MDRCRRQCRPAAHSSLQWIPSQPRRAGLPTLQSLESGSHFRAAARLPLLRTDGLISGLIRPLSSNCSYHSSHPKFAVERIWTRDHLPLGSLRIRRPPSARCTAASNPFPAASSGGRSISSYTSMWTSPQSPALSRAPERARILSMQSCTAATSRSPPRLRGPFRSLTALPSQLHWNTTSFLRLSLVHLFLIFISRFGKFSPLKQSNFFLDHVAKRISQSYVKWMDNTARLTIHSIGAYFKFPVTVA